MPTKKVQFVGKVLQELPQCTSTNDFAFDQLKDHSVKEGTVYYTFCQTKGRGQSNNRWLSEPYRNIAFSTVLFPTFLKPKEQTYLSQAVALAARQLFTMYTKKRVNVKWPNDIYIDEKKVGGILIQNVLTSNQINCSVVGIGLNINQRVFPDALANASSLAAMEEQDYNLQELCLDLCVCLDKFYLQLQRRRFAEIYQQYKKHLYNRDVSRWFEDTSGNRFKGTITAVDEAGRLIVATNGAIKTFNLKEIRMI